MASAGRSDPTLRLLIESNRASPPGVLHSDASSNSGILGGSKGGDVSLNLLDGRIFFEDRGAREAKELGVREKILDGHVVIAELRPMALVEDEDHSLVAE